MHKREGRATVTGVFTDEGAIRVTAKPDTTGGNASKDYSIQQAPDAERVEAAH